MKTVMDVITANLKASVILAQRHYSYLMGPLLARCPDKNIAYARNYARIEPDTLFLCDEAGIKRGWEHGRQLAETGIKGIEVITSRQGRGPDSGLRVSEGFYKTTGEWLPVTTCQAVDYPVYDYDQVLHCLKTLENPDSLVALWLNGQDDIIRFETPESFCGRVTGFINGLIKKPGVWVITTHFEMALLAHSIYVANKELGDIPEDWSPEKGGGVILVKNQEEELRAFDYDANYNLIT